MATFIDWELAEGDSSAVHAECPNLQSIATQIIKCDKLDGNCISIVLMLIMKPASLHADDFPLSLPLSHNSGFSPLKCYDHPT